MVVVGSHHTSLPPDRSAGARPRHYIDTSFSIFPFFRVGPNFSFFRVGPNFLIFRVGRSDT